MPSYRMFYRDRSGMIRGRSDFDAENDGDAMVIAEHLCEACSDACETFELWQSARQVDLAYRKAPRPPIGTVTMTAKMQDSLVRCEEAVRDSQWLIASSERLLQRLNGLKKGARNDT